MGFTKEAEFEEALIRILFNKGWEQNVIKYPTEQDLIDNWADILFENNRGIDHLNNVPLTKGEMDQILEQIAMLRTPLRLNGFINGRTVSIKRDNIDDPEHFGKEISLKIYDRKEIAAGQSRYQIVQQPKFAAKSKLLPERRGDLMLLINGMPVIHIELKRSGAQVEEAWQQIKKYAAEGIFSGILSLIQVFVAMTPEEMLYFANPGPDGDFNENYFFHWADFNNEPVNDWKRIAADFLSIPMAHELIGFYTVADNSDGVLKVMRSYQYYAANRISDRVAKTQWGREDQLGGYVWHTTGSGKTMTSFKSAQLIAASGNADKVIFLMDRIELGTQSLSEYRGFADENQSVQETENTNVLIGKLKSDDYADTLIVTSIQKMSRIKDEEGGLRAEDIKKMNRKKIVFIIDEAHRSTFGDMLMTIKDTFPTAIFFGFTGTPIQTENEKKRNTTATVFGNELHRYSIADGIRDGNVLGFDPYRVSTYKDYDVRKAVALHQANASTVEEAVSDPEKAKVYYHFMDTSKVKMAGDLNGAGEYVEGIEDYLPKQQYRREEHQKKVVEDILNQWMTLSHHGKFHGLFATSSIPEAIEYYRRIKAAAPELKVTALFDPNIDNKEGQIFKEDGLVEIMDDYNDRYGQNFELSSHGAFKKDIASRLAHKNQYKRIDREPEKQLDLLIVVDQMLTGFDSKWINTLYMDKVMEYENIIQAFSRTNRLFGPEKSFGTIRYYRYPHTMERNINRAVKLYSGDKPAALFVQKLEQNLLSMNHVFDEIQDIFRQAGIDDFARLPEEPSEKKKFAVLFKSFHQYLEAAKIQGFRWNQLSYEFKHGKGKPRTTVEMHMDETTYQILALRYKELSAGGEKSGGVSAAYNLEGYLMEISTGAIDADYMNSRFEKYLKLLRTSGSADEEIEQALDDLHKTFATLDQEEQKYANLFLHDVQSGDVEIEEGFTFREKMFEYKTKAKNDQIHRLAACIGLDEEKLRTLMELPVTDANLNEYGRFDELKETADKEKAKAFFEKQEGRRIPLFKVNIKLDELLRRFILTGGFEVE